MGNVDSKPEQRVFARFRHEATLATVMTDAAVCRHEANRATISDYDVTVRVEDNSHSKPEFQVDSRVTLALERTLLAWTRTALAVMGFGFVVARLPLLVQELATGPRRAAGVDPTNTPNRFDVAIIVLGVAIQLIAMVTHSHSVRRIRGGAELPMRVMSPAYVFGIVFVAVGAIVALHLSGIF